jgi:hypothetical protein
MYVNLYKILSSNLFSNAKLINSVIAYSLGWINRVILIVHIKNSKFLLPLLEANEFAKKKMHRRKKSIFPNYIFFQNWKLVRIIETFEKNMNVILG